MKINKQIAKKLSAYGLGATLVLAGAGTVSEFEGKKATKHFRSYKKLQLSAIGKQSKLSWRLQNK